MMPWFVSRQYTRRIDDVEGRVEAYDLGLPKDLNHEFASLEAEESSRQELDALKERVAAEKEPRQRPSNRVLEEQKNESRHLEC